ncbi:MAG: hypothetical protein AABY15_03205 [Nanoarchaeota archaeon]
MSKNNIIIGKKGKNEFNGCVFYPYIPILSIKLPVVFIGFDDKNQPIFKKQ